MGIPFAPYACGGGHLLSATPLRLPFFFPRCWRPLLASPSPRLGPGVTCCGPVPCRMRPVGRRQCGGAWLCWFLCVCVHGLSGVSRIPPLPCPIPSAHWHPAPFLLAHALAVLPLAAALGGLVFHTWLVVVCGSLSAFVPSFLLAAPWRPLLHVFGCIAYLALLAAACMCEYSMGIPFAPHMCVRGWACSLGYSSSVTFGSVVIVVLFPLVWRGVACNILVLVLSH